MAAPAPTTHGDMAAAPAAPPALPSQLADGPAARVRLNMLLRQVAIRTQTQCEHSDCFQTVVPVDKVPDFHSFVDPRDATACLEQVLSRTRAGFYSSVHEFRREYEQVLANALVYNSPGHGRHAHGPVIGWAQELLDRCCEELAARHAELHECEQLLKETPVTEAAGGKDGGNGSPRGNDKSAAISPILSSMEALVAACELAAEREGLEDDDSHHYFDDVVMATGAAGSGKARQEELWGSRAGSGSGADEQPLEETLEGVGKMGGGAGGACDGSTWAGGAVGKAAAVAAAAADVPSRHRRHKSKVFIRPNKVVYLPTSFMEENFDAASLPINCEMIVETNGEVQAETHMVAIKAVPRQGLSTMYCMTNVLSFQREYLGWQILGWTKVDASHIQIHLQGPGGSAKGSKADADDVFSDAQPRTATKPPPPLPAAAARGPTCVKAAAEPASHKRKSGSGTIRDNRHQYSGAGADAQERSCHPHGSAPLAVAAAAAKAEEWHEDQDAAMDAMEHKAAELGRAQSAGGDTPRWRAGQQQWQQRRGAVPELWQRSPRRASASLPGTVQQQQQQRRQRLAAAANAGSGGSANDLDSGNSSPSHHAVCSMLKADDVFGSAAAAADLCAASFSSAASLGLMASLERRSAPGGVLSPFRPHQGIGLAQLQALNLSQLQLQALQLQYQAMQYGTFPLSLPLWGSGGGMLSFASAGVAAGCPLPAAAAFKGNDSCAEDAFMAPAAAAMARSAPLPSLLASLSSLVSADSALQQDGAQYSPAAAQAVLAARQQLPAAEPSAAAGFAIGRAAGAVVGGLYMPDVNMSAYKRHKVAAADTTTKGLSTNGGGGLVLDGPTAYGHSGRVTASVTTALGGGSVGGAASPAALHLHHAFSL